MKRKLPLCILFASVFFIFNACQEGPIEKISIQYPDPIIPDFADKINSSVSGFIMDDNGDPIVFAEVTAGNKTVLTDEYGYFKITNASVARIAAQVTAKKDGFFNGYKTFQPEENEATFVRLQLVSREEIGVIDASTGGDVTTTDGGKISLPASGIVNAVTGVAYTGQVHVSASVLNPTNVDDLASTIPGDGRGTNTEGYLEALKMFSMIAVELTSASNQALQIAEGKSATINLPIPSALAGEAPETISLWSYDTEEGLWKEEGTATRNGNMYIGSVSHFSFWSGAIGTPLVNFTARVVNQASQPLSNVPVSVTIAGMPKNAGHGRFGYTDANGYITGAVFANANLVLDILTPCALSVYEHSFSTGAADVDLGTLTGNLGQNTVTISGSVLNCNNQPVASGYVQTYDNGFYNRIPVTNGNFSFTGIACTNTTVNVVAVDLNSYEQNAPEGVTLNAGANNLGTLTACGTSTMGFITYQIDNLPPVTIAEPADTIGAYFIEGTATQIITLSGEPNIAQKMSFQIAGTDDVEATHTVTDLYSAAAFVDGHGYWPAPITVTITEFGNVGGFISGSFSSKIIDTPSNAVHDITCSFRVRRYH